MRKTILIIILLITFGNSFSQQITESHLIGEWNFIELQDENGKKQTKIPISKFGQGAIENVNRDSYLLKENGEYESTNPLNTSSGFWFYDSENNQLNLELRISPDDKFLPSLKKAKIVEKRKDGFYYQKPVKKQILYFSKDSLTIADREKYYLIYRRK